MSDSSVRKKTSLVLAARRHRTILLDRASSEARPLLGFCLSSSDLTIRLCPAGFLSLGSL